MSINKKGKNVKPAEEELKPELISWEEIKENVQNMEETSPLLKYKKYLILAMGILSTGSFFFLGRMSKSDIQANPLSVSYQNYSDADSQVANLVSADVIGKLKYKSKPKPTQKVVPTPISNGEVIGSKSGKKYYFPWCGTVKRIKLENQIHFKSIQDAKSAGFTPGGNCKGLE